MQTVSVLRLLSGGFHASFCLVGFGGFGIEMAKRAQGYNLTILAIDPVRTEKPAYVAELKPTNRENLHSLLGRSDVVMMACPLTQRRRVPVLFGVPILA